MFGVWFYVMSFPVVTEYEFYEYFMKKDIIAKIFKQNKFNKVSKIFK